jgi:hypothetical protein
MENAENNSLKDEDFELLDLGTVSEETRGGREIGEEYFVGPNSRKL